MTHYIAKVESRVAGIPCLIGITDYAAPDRSASGSTDFCGYSEWVVLDTRGRPAPWLERKLTAQVKASVESSLNEYFN